MVERKYKFEVALSFAGDDRSIAADLRSRLERAGVATFYDRDAQSRLWGGDLNRSLRLTYGEESRFVLPLITKSYPQSLWALKELSVALEAEQRRGEDVVLPVVIDHVEVPGLSKSKGYWPFTEMGGIPGIVEAVAEKLECGVIRGIFVADWEVWFPKRIEEGTLKILEGESYAETSDRLEGELLAHLSSGDLGRVVQCEASSRDGETLGLRVAFLWDRRGMRKSALADFGPWEFLAIAPAVEVYGRQIEGLVEQFPEY